MKNKLQTPLFGYGLAVACTALATWVHIFSRPLLGNNVPYITYFPAVFVCALLTRLGPTLVAVVLSGFSAAFWLIPSGDALLPQSVAAWVGLALFNIFGVGVALLAERTRRNRVQVEEQRERFSVTLASLGEGVLVTDQQARVTFLNQAAEQLTGWTLAAAKGKPLEAIFQISNEQTGEPEPSVLLQAIEENRIVRKPGYWMLRAQDGAQTPVMHNAAPIHAPDGRAVGVALVFHDVTEQRASQVTARRLAALVDSSVDAIFGQTFDGVVTDWNRGAERLYGYAPDEIIGQSIFSTIVPAGGGEAMRDVLRRVQAGLPCDQLETVRRHKDGRTLYVSCRVSPIHNASGSIVAASAIDRDVSHQRATERRRNARLAITQLLAQETAIDETAQKILSIIGLAVEWEAGCFWRLESDGATLRCRQFWARRPQDLARFEQATRGLALGRGDGLPGQVWEAGGPLWKSDVTADPQFKRGSAAAEADLHGAFACPLVVGEKLIGVLELLSRDVQRPDDDLLEMMTTIGAQIGQFIDRREAARQLTRSEQELSDFFENAAVGLHWVGPDGVVLRVNQAELELLGYSREEYVGRHIAEFHVDEPVINDILTRLKAGEQLDDYPARLRCKDGSIRHVLIDSNVLWEGDQFIHTRCFTRDVTERKQAETSLRESEERLRLALEAGRMGTWEWNIEKGEVLWSPTLERVHGLAPGAFEGTFEAYQRDIHPDDRERVLETIRQTVELGRAHRLEYRIVWPDESVHWLEARGKLFRDEAGQPQRVVGVCSDVTERKGLEEQLQRQVEELEDAESRTRSVVDNVIDGIITIDQRGEIASFNAAAERIFDYTASEVIGQNIRILMPEPYHSEHDAYLENYLATGVAKIIGVGREVTGRRRDGFTFPLDLAVSEFQFGHQRFFTGIVRDITERKDFETSLRFLAEASRSLSSLVDYKSTLQRVAHLAVPAFADWCAVDMLDVDAAGKLERLAVAHVDPEKVALAEQLYRDYPPSADDPLGVMKVVRTGTPDVATDIPDSMLTEVAEDEEHLRLLRQLHLTSYMCVPLRVKQRILGVMTFAAAESGRRYGADDLAMAEDLANRAAVAIENARLYHKVREADRRKDEFLAMLAHELRNPLVPIRSGLDILSMQGVVEEKTIDIMKGQVEHIIRLVDDLLDVSRIMQGKIELRKEPVQLAAVLRQSVEAVRPLIDGNRQQFDVETGDEAIWLYADPVRVVQIIENLLHNASKYTDPEGCIQLHAAREGGEAIITVRDTGVGIEAELLPNVFDLFTQSSRALDRSQGGLGIGLTLVQRLVELHDGTVAVRSDGLGQGSTFSVRLPAADMPAAAESAAPETEESESRRILVVDDNQGSAWLLAQLLGKMGDHQIEIAYDGPTALDKIRETHPEIVLLDIGLPGLDGYQVGSTVREDPHFDDVLLIALTGYGQAEDRRRSKEAGFDEHLVKPPSVDQMQGVLTHPKLSMVRPA